MKIKSDILFLKNLDEVTVLDTNFQPLLYPNIQRFQLEKELYKESDILMSVGTITVGLPQDVTSFNMLLQADTIYAANGNEYFRGTLAYFFKVKTYDPTSKTLQYKPIYANTKVQIYKNPLERSNVVNLDLNFCCFAIGTPDWLISTEVAFNLSVSA